MTQCEKTIYFLKNPWVVALYTLLVVLAYRYVDRDLAIYVHQFDFRAHAPALRCLTILGQWEVYLVIFLLLILYFHLGKNSLSETRVKYLLGCVLIINLICFVLKIILSRARPELLFATNQFGFYWFKLEKLYWSFPSGHTMTIVGLAAGLGVLFPSHFYAFLCLAILVAATRIMLYYHYLSDVMAGLYLSLLIIGWFTQYLKRNNWFKKIV